MSLVTSLEARWPESVWARILLVTGVGILVVLTDVALVRGARFAAALGQHANAVNVRYVVQVIELYRSMHGNYPGSLAEVQDLLGSRGSRDQYGNELFYQAHGDGYVLVSYGWLGRSDGGDYWSIREGTVPRPEEFRWGKASTCGMPWRDMVLSDRGIHRACFLN